MQEIFPKPTNYEFHFSQFNMAARMNMSPEGRFQQTARIKVHSTTPPEAQGDPLYYFDSFWHMLYYSQCPKVAHVQAKLLRTIKQMRHSTILLSSLSGSLALTAAETQREHNNDLVELGHSGVGSSLSVAGGHDVFSSTLTATPSRSRFINGMAGNQTQRSHHAGTGPAVFSNNSDSAFTSSRPPLKKQRVSGSNHLITDAQPTNQLQRTSSTTCSTPLDSAEAGQAMAMTTMRDENGSCYVDVDLGLSTSSSFYTGEDTNRCFLEFERVKIGGKEFYKTCNLWLCGCILPSFESSSILRDGDAVHVQIVYIPKDTVVSLPQPLMARQIAAGAEGAEVQEPSPSRIQSAEKNRRSPLKHYSPGGEASPAIAQTQVVVSPMRRILSATKCKGYKCLAPSPINVKGGQMKDAASTSKVDVQAEKKAAPVGNDLNYSGGQLQEKKDASDLNESMQTDKPGTGDGNVQSRKKQKKKRNVPSAENHNEKSSTTPDSKTQPASSEEHSQRANLMTPEIQDLLRKKISQLSKEKEREKKQKKGASGACAEKEFSVSLFKKNSAAPQLPITFTSEELADGIMSAKRKRNRRKKKKKSWVTEDVVVTRQPQRPSNYTMKLPEDQQPQNIRLVFDVSDEEVNEVDKSGSNDFNPSDYDTSQITAQSFVAEPDSSHSTSQQFVPDESDSAQGDISKENEPECEKINDFTTKDEDAAGSENVQPVTFSPADTACFDVPVTPVRRTPVSREAQSAGHRRSNTIAMRFGVSPAQRKSSKPVGNPVDPNAKFEELLSRRRVRSHRGVSSWGDAADEDHVMAGREKQKFKSKERSHDATVVAGSKTSENPQVQCLGESQSVNRVDAREKSDVARANACENVEVTLVGIDFDKVPKLDGLPQIGDVIGFKVMELGEDYTPNLSNFKVGRVTSFDQQTDNIEIEVEHQEEQRKRTGRFEMTLSDTEDGPDEALISTTHSQLYEVCLVQRP